VLPEEGEVALVAAACGQFTEVARFPAMDDKTWNHPVPTGDIPLVLNGREMVAFRLPLEGAPATVALRNGDLRRRIAFRTSW